MDWPTVLRGIYDVLERDQGRTETPTSRRCERRSETSWTRYLAGTVGQGSALDTIGGPAGVTGTARLGRRDIDREPEIALPPRPVWVYLAFAFTLLYM